MKPYLQGLHKIKRTVEIREFYLNPVQNGSSLKMSWFGSKTYLGNLLMIENDEFVQHINPKAN